MAAKVTIGDALDSINTPQSYPRPIRAPGTASVNIRTRVYNLLDNNEPDDRGHKPYSNLIQTYLEIYGRYFTQQEIDEITRDIT